MQFLLKFVGFLNIDVILDNKFVWMSATLHDAAWADVAASATLVCKFVKSIIRKIRVFFVESDIFTYPPATPQEPLRFRDYSLPEKGEIAASDKGDGQ